MAVNDLWFPLVDDDKCDGCQKLGNPRCIEFCPNKVFELRDGKAFVVKPLDCGKGCGVTHCSACALRCHKKAIIFPNQSTSKTIVPENKGWLIKLTCKKCKKVYWSDKEKDYCFDCSK